MGDLVYSYDYVNSSLGYTYHYEYILDDAEILESVETPFTLQISAGGQQTTMQIYRSGFYFVDTRFIIFIIANKETYLRRYQNGVEDAWTRMQETNGDGAYAYLGYTRIDGVYYPKTENGTYTSATSNFYVNPIVHQLDTLSDYLDWVTNSAPLGGTVVVDYQFPEGGSYEYAKIVFKKNRIPADVTDGYAVDIDPTATSVQVEGISKTLGTKYYFAIFTDKSVSDEFVYEVGRVWDGSETTLLWSGNSNKLTAKIANSHIVFTFYSGDTVIYSFNSAVGTGVADIGKIYVSFLIDHDFQVAKPSFIYDNGDSTYSYNQETPTDAQMADLYTWVNAGLGG